MTRPAKLLSFVAVLLAALPGRSHAQGSSQQDWQEEGEASWYGPRHAGLPTSSGEIFDPARLTAAHSTLPLGSRVRVTMQDTGASVVVTINDRQPFHKTRIIDLSRGAASRLGLLRAGTAMVTLSPAGTDDPVEVASAPDAPFPAPNRPRHDRQHTRRARQVAAAARPCCHVRSASRVPHSAPRRVAQHRP